MPPGELSCASDSGSQRCSLPGPADRQGPGPGSPRAGVVDNQRSWPMSLPIAVSERHPRPRPGNHYLEFLFSKLVFVGLSGSRSNQWNVAVSGQQWTLQVEERNVKVAGQRKRGP